MGTINEDLTAIQTIETGLTSNKVANFAYTDYAYEHDDVDGVPSYNPNNEQNIPVGTTEAMKVNSTVLTQGWRAQASAITRMLMNHFLGRISYNLNKVNDNMASLLSTLLSHLGTANGIATLDNDSRVPYSQLPQGTMTLEGYWNASTNTPELSDSAEGNVKGQYYNVSVAGTQNLGSGVVTYLVGDSVIFDGSIWKKVSGGSVRTVNGASPDNNGAVVITGSNVRVSNTDSTLLSKFHLRDIFSSFLGKWWKQASTIQGTSTTYLPTDGISYADGVFVAWDYSTDSNVCKLAYSTNAKDWSACILPEGYESTRIAKLEHCNDKWIAFPVNTSGNDLFVLYSLDGINFQLGTITSTIAISGGTAGAIKYIEELSKYFACFDKTDVFVSSNGIDWTTSTTFYTATGRTMSNIEYSNGNLVAVTNRPPYYSSDEGETWTQTDSFGSVTVGGKNCVKLPNGNLVFAYNNKNPYYSTDGGVTWIASTLPGELTTLTAVSSNNLLVLVNNKVFALTTSGIYVTNTGNVFTLVSELANVYFLAYKNGIYLVSLYTGLFYTKNLIDENYARAQLAEDTWDVISTPVYPLVYGNGTWVGLKNLASAVYYSDFSTLIETGEVELSD